MPRFDAVLASLTDVTVVTDGAADVGRLLPLDEPVFVVVAGELPEAEHDEQHRTNGEHVPAIHRRSRSTYRR